MAHSEQTRRQRRSLAGEWADIGMVPSETGETAIASPLRVDTAQDYFTLEGTETGVSIGVRNRSRDRSPSPPAFGDRVSSAGPGSVSLLTATLRVMSPQRRSQEQLDELAGWTPSSTDDDAIRDTAGIRVPRRPSIGRRQSSEFVSSDSNDDEGASTIHPRNSPLSRSPTSSRMMSSSSDVTRRRKRPATRGQRALSPSGYPRTSTQVRSKQGGAESEAEDASTAMASSTFNELFDATRDLVTLSTSTSSRALSSSAGTTTIASAPSLGATARFGPSDRSSPGDLSAADLPSSFAASSGGSDQRHSSPSQRTSASPTLPSRGPSKPRGWSALLTATIHLRVWQMIGIAGLLLGAGVFCGYVESRSMRVLRSRV